jgi:hypothetical protein
VTEKDIKPSLSLHKTKLFQKEKVKKREREIKHKRP